MITNETWEQSIRLSEVRKDPVTRILKAGEADRAKLAKDLGLEAIHRLDATVRVSPWFDGARLEGRFSAEVVLICGVSLEPFDSTLSGQFDLHVVPAESPNAPNPDDHGIEVEPDADDPPDVLESDVIDLTAYVVEHLTLEIPAFPRKPGAVFEAPPEEKPDSPFAVLRLLKGEPDEA